MILNEGEDLNKLGDAGSKSDDILSESEGEEVKTASCDGASVDHMIRSVLELCEFKDASDLPVNHFRRSYAHLDLGSPVRPKEASPSV